jgi:hypothetical protein
MTAVDKDTLARQLQDMHDNKIQKQASNQLDSFVHVQGQHHQANLSLFDACPAPKMRTPGALAEPHIPGRVTE